MNQFRISLLLFFILVVNQLTNSQVITITTKLQPQQKIELRIVPVNSEVVINGVKEPYVASNLKTTYTLTSPKVTITGRLKAFQASGCSLTDIEITNQEALEELDVSLNNLTLLTLPALPSLTKLSVYANQLSNINVKHLNALTNLKCTNNKLTELDVSGNHNLIELTCSQNQIEELNLAQCKELEILKCYNNRITTLNLANNVKLKNLWCSGNKLRSLGVSSLTSLRALWCYGNNLSGLILPNSPFLQWLDCSNNKLSQLQLYEFPKLYRLLVYSNAISEEQMPKIIASLTPNEQSQPKVFFVVDTQAESELNQCSSKQVSMAKQKGWSVLDFKGGANNSMGVPYEGKDSNSCNNISYSFYVEQVGAIVVYDSPNALIQLYNMRGELLLESVCNENGIAYIDADYIPNGNYVLVTSSHKCYKIAR